MLRLEGIEKRYGAAHALAGLSLEVGENELLAVLGPSGSGKSTLLRIVAGLEPPDGGRVLVGGRDVTHTEPGAREVAMVFQSFALFPHLTVAENVGFGLSARRTPPAEREQRVREAAAALELEPLLERRPSTLSGGERQRVALARALAGRPRVLLMDEPLSNLDAPLRDRARREIRRVHAETGATLVYVTHDQAEALSLGQRVAVLDRGRLRQVADPDTVYDHPADAFVARFVGSPPMNLVTAEVDAGALRATGGIVLPLPPGASGARRNGRVLAGFRAEGARCPAPAGEGFGARLEAVERSGHERLWELSAGGQRLVVRPDPTARAEPGAEVRVAVAPEAVRVFDPEPE